MKRKYEEGETKGEKTWVQEMASQPEVLAEFSRRQAMVWPGGLRPGVLRQAKRLCLQGLDVAARGAGFAPMETKEIKDVSTALNRLDISAMYPVLNFLSWADVARWLVGRGRAYALDRDYLFELLRWMSRHVFTRYGLIRTDPLVSRPGSREDLPLAIAGRHREPGSQAD